MTFIYCDTEKAAKRTLMPLHFGCIITLLNNDFADSRNEKLCRLILEQSVSGMNNIPANCIQLKVNSTLRHYYPQTYSNKCHGLFCDEFFPSTCLSHFQHFPQFFSQTRCKWPQKYNESKNTGFPSHEKVRAAP